MKTEEALDRGVLKRDPDLTGRIGYRLGWFGRLIVQVEWRDGEWRDASIGELFRAHYEQHGDHEWKVTWK